MGIRIDRGNPYKKRHDTEIQTTMYGTWKYFIENDQAILWDFVGDASILILPKRIGVKPFTVSEKIPDDAFSSCENVEYILCNHNTSFGDRVFANCRCLQGVVSTEEGVEVTINPTSFFEPVFLSRLVAENAAETQAAGSGAEALFKRVLADLALHNDTENLEILIDYQSVGNAFRTALENGSLHTLKALRHMGFPLSDVNPFSCYLDAPIEQRDYRTLRFMVQNGFSKVSDSFKRGLSFKSAEEKREMMKLLLSAGTNPEKLDIPVSEGLIKDFVGLVDSGTCEDGLTWKIDSVGVLTIEGTGDMKDYAKQPLGKGWCTTAPWGKYTPYIRSLRIGDGITSIGAYAFYQCRSLEQAAIGESVLFIENHAFYGCTFLKYMYCFGPSPVLKNEAFAFCDALSNRLPVW